MVLLSPAFTSRTRAFYEAEVPISTVPIFQPYRESRKTVNSNLRKIRDLLFGAGAANLRIAEHWIVLDNDEVARFAFDFIKSLRYKDDSGRFAVPKLPIEVYQNYIFFSRRGFQLAENFEIVSTRHADPEKVE